MLKKSLSIIMALTMLLTTFTAINAVFAVETENPPENTESFKEGDTVYFDYSQCGGNWESADALMYINFTSYTREDNGGSVVISDCDKEKYNPVVVTTDLGNSVCSYTFTAETAGATDLRFWRGSEEKLWNNSPLLTYKDFANGLDLVKATDLEGNGTLEKYNSESIPDDTNLKFAYAKKNQLYAHGINDNGVDTEAWQMWQHKMNGEGVLENSGDYYLFLPSSAHKANVEIYNTFNSDVKISDVTIPANGTVTMSYDTNATYSVTVNSQKYNLHIMRSGAECAVYVNNSDLFEGKDLYSYLCEQKSNNASATGAVTDSKGNIMNTPIKKIKGRGNTSWGKSKKSFNITYDSAIEIDGMDKTKKFSICANYQDDSLTRNRFLYDLGDQVGIPYNSDSRYADFYINGVYMGSYQMCQKIEVGKNALIPDITGEEYLNSDGTLAEEYPFFIKVDGGDDDFRVRICNNDVTLIAPELTMSDKYANEVKAYITEKFTAMYNAIKNNSDNLSDIVDMDSFARMYLINEFGKNWDAGAGSYYFIYMKDKDGKYKFFAAPTWDYDNSLGNAVGINVKTYKNPTSFFVTTKGRDNIASMTYKNPQLYQKVGQLWYKDFVPAIENIFKGNNISTGELYSADAYYNLVKESAAMNYTSGRLLNPEPGWIADHSSLFKCNFDYATKTYSQDTTATKYNVNTFKGVYDFMVDWATSRAAWLSNEFIDFYVDPSQGVTTPPTTEPPTTQPTTEHIVGKNSLIEFSFDSTNKVEEEKLDEYGSKSGYKAIFGPAMLKASVNGTDDRALEWSVAEYGESGNEMVPLMTAGNKNPWGASQYIQMDFSATNYSDLAITFEMAGSKKAPANWKLQYCIDGENFVDIENTNFTIPLEKRKLMTSYIKDLVLPKECNGAENLTLRIVATSDVTVSGGKLSDDPTGGEVAINNIVITGKTAKAGIMGDLNLDGEVTVQDAVFLQKAVTKFVDLNIVQGMVADFNGDGKINIKDCTDIQRDIVKIQ